MAMTLKFWIVMTKHGAWLGAILRYPSGVAGRRGMTRAVMGRLAGLVKANPCTIATIIEQNTGPKAGVLVLSEQGIALAPRLNW